MFNKLKTDFKVEKNVPIPSIEVATKSSKYDFHKLEFEVGDSFLVTEHKVLNAFLSYVNQYRKKSLGHKYLTRKVGENQWRIWRVS
tara:strand:- start:330 stop:587 length:258 start_codon:yes stop_codon:yes gene_type:complete